MKILLTSVFLFAVISSSYGEYVLLKDDNGERLQQTFLKAYIECIDRNMILATPDTESKNDYLHVFIKFHSIVYAWTAAHDMLTSSYFEWITTGEPVTNEGVWHEGRPATGEGNENCVEIDHSGHESAWTDIHCAWFPNVICETASAEAVALAKSRIPLLKEALEKHNIHA